MAVKKADPLEEFGFTFERDLSRFRRLALATVGGEKSGKSHFAIMTAPDPLAVVSLDAGTDEIVDKARAAGRRVYHYPIRVPRPKVIAGQEEQKVQQKIYGPLWDKYARAWEAIAAAKHLRTAIADTFTEAYELARLAYFGKLAQVKPQHYVEVNAEFRNLVKGTYDERPDLNLIYIHKTKKEYREGSKGDSNWTGRYEQAGFGDTNYIVDLIVRHGYDVANRCFTVTVPKTADNCNCRFGDHMVGFELPGDADLPVDFATLAMEAVPGSSLEDWS